MSMEKRALLAAVLMAVVFAVGQYLFPPTETPPAPKPEARGQAKPDAATQAKSEPASKPDATKSEPKSAVTPPPAAAAPRAEVPRPPQTLLTVETPLYQAVVSSEGGKLQQFTLKYRGEKPLVVVGDLGPSGVVVGPAGTTDPLPMQMSASRLDLSAQRPTGTVELVGQTDAVRVTKTLTFRYDDFTIGVKLRVENLTAAPQTPQVSLAWTTRQAWHQTTEKFQGQHPTEIVWHAAGHVAHVENLCEVPAETVPGDWVAAGSVWYIAALIPQTPDFKLHIQGEDKKVCEGGTKTPVGRATIAVQATPTLAPRQAWDGDILVYAGPKEYDRLRAHGLEGAINFGGFPVPRRYGGLPMEWLGVPVLKILNWVHRHVGNYGLAIILLTVVTKALFYPLTVKSMRSMKAMQALQPQINALRSKYKSDPQRLQKETMELYRANKVNPAGGCLPMIAQIPVFYALYLALSVSVELQNASFLCFGRVFGVDLWICDLATHDPTYVLPILMGVTMFIQQKMTPVAGDPRQAKMMLFMPVVFTFMFLNLPAGLVLYWTVSNILQIAQQWYMDRGKAAAAAGREVKNASRA
jgi:YidC/Oxa1 family membrane protein insertase